MNSVSGMSRRIKAVAKIVRFLSFRFSTGV